MQIIDLKISGYCIRLENADKDLTLVTHPKFDRFKTSFRKDIPDLTIKVSSGRVVLPPDAECIFEASYSEDDNTSNENSDFWSLI